LTKQSFYDLVFQIEVEAGEWLDSDVSLHKHWQITSTYWSLLATIANVFMLLSSWVRNILT